MMTKSLSGKIFAVLVITLAAGCHNNQPVGNSPASQQVQQNNGAGTATAADSNAASMGVPGSQPARAQQQNDSEIRSASGPTAEASAVPPNSAGPAANAGPVLSARPAAGMNSRATFQAIQAINVPSGTVLKIRLNETLNVKHTQTGQSFTGSVVDAVDVSGSPAIKRGAAVTGVVDRSHRRGHFKGASVLELRLTSLDQDGQHYRIGTRDLVRTKKGKGKRSTGFIGGGAGLGMLIGGVATGGVGLLVGGLAGGGAGTLGAAFTGNRDIKIPAESVLTFRLADSIQIHP